MRILACVLLLLSVASVARSADRKFEEQVIDPQIGKVCYAVTLADVNGDGREDVVSVSETKVCWYENPTWKRRVIISDQTTADNVCIVPHDVDGDGKIDFVVGAGWTGKNTGTIQWLSRGDSLEKPWHVYAIGAEPSLHRMRWADVLGTGREQLTISPLNATQGNGVRLMAFEIPANPRTDRWPSTIINHDLNRMHNHWHYTLPDGTVETLTASREGVMKIRKQGDEFPVFKIGSGATSEDLNSNGAGEVKIGRTKSGKDFVTSVEPMHGTMLAVYLPTEEGGEQTWKRTVIDEGFRRGHALWTADMNGDGSDDIVFGHSDTPGKFGVNVYVSVEKGEEITWEKTVVDAGGMATEDLMVGDLDGDGFPEIVAGGRSTQNVKIYWNKP